MMLPSFLIDNDMRKDYDSVFPTLSIMLSQDEDTVISY